MSTDKSLERVEFPVMTRKHLAALLVSSLLPVVMAIQSLVILQCSEMRCVVVSSVLIALVFLAELVFLVISIIETCKHARASTRYRKYLDQLTVQSDAYRN
jgi:hypothetical protein